MADKSKIEWTDATWNPIVGCSVVSPGCTNCYAMSQARRIELMSDGWHSKGAGRQVEGRSHYAGTTKVVNGNPVWTGNLALAPYRILTKPMRMKKPRMIFVNSMGDLFHEDCPDEWIDQVFAVMALAPQHTFQVLTKRSKRMRAYLTTMHGSDVIPSPGPAILEEARKITPFWNLTEWPLPNVWLGVSTEDQKRANERIPDLLHTPAAVRFISAEPLLGAIDLSHIDLAGGDEEVFPLRWPEGRDDYPCHPFLDWVIVGGESQSGARPMHPDWARSLRDQCEAARVPFFFKQWGEWLPGSGGITDRRIDGPNYKVLDPECSVSKVGKARAGRLLDGREHNGMPEARR